ncbi:hypothetical protein GCM10027516_30930 [Niabella aquatica]
MVICSVTNREKQELETSYLVEAANFTLPVCILLQPLAPDVTSSEKRQRIKTATLIEKLIAVSKVNKDQIDPA